MSSFSGSYDPADVEFLLKPLCMEPIADIELKERLIQSGKKHYSEMISVEQQPDTEYLELFDRSVKLNLPKMAEDLYWVTRRIRAARSTEEIVIVSLARAGTPIGIGIKRLLEQEFSTPSKHYSISIIRDRGIDARALEHILGRHSAESLVFVDGWTGKGAISQELEDSLLRYKGGPIGQIPRDLFVLCDLGGVATACGSAEDYLIPSAILNSTVSGLVSRTILNHLVSPKDFHGCLFYEELAEFDRSRWFVEHLIYGVTQLLSKLRMLPSPAIETAIIRQRMLGWIETLKNEFSISNVNLIKPGICEATRALLRRSAQTLFVREPASDQTQHLLHLAEKNKVKVAVREDMPFLATVLIRSLSHG